MQKRKKRKYILTVLLLLLFGMAIWKKRDLQKKENGTCVSAVMDTICDAAVHTVMPGLILQMDNTADSVMEYLLSKTGMLFPQIFFQKECMSYELQTESKLDYDQIIALEAGDENYIEEDTGKLIGNGMHEEITLENDKQANTVAPGSGSEKKVEYPIEKLNDFDFLIQNFYRVDATTTIAREELNASEMLSQNLHLSEKESKAKILIYHTHSREKYEGNPQNIGSVVEVGNYLAELLQNTYKIPVLHETGCYDEVRDVAYTKAAPALEKLLTEHPEIEVVIDLHRDGVGNDTHLVTDINGKSTAQIMFFNGLSRTTAGNISYLPNENLKTNLAFSFQMQLAANEYYPNFSRCIYLKGYRYNMHYCPKTLLVEVGAQTNTYEEARNAMEPLADILNKVIQ